MRPVVTMMARSVMAAALAFSMSAKAIESLSLDGLWDFSLAEGAKVADATCDFAADDKMPVPCCFDLTPKYYMKRGTALQQIRH